MSLSGHQALVTGGTQGVGQAIANALAAAGADLILHGLEDDESARRALDQCRAFGTKVHLICSDLSQQPAEATNELYRRSLELLPNIDLLVNNAGTCIDGPFLEMSPDAFDLTIKLNVYAYYFLAQAIAKDWVSKGIRGRMLLTGSINGRLAEPDHSAYDTSKGAVEMMVKTLCVSLAPHGIRVNGLAPGLFYTPLTTPALSEGSLARWMELHTPNGTVPNADVAGDSAVFLLGDGASHVNGHMMLVDGGMSAWQQPDPPEQF